MPISLQDLLMLRPPLTAPLLGATPPPDNGDEEQSSVSHWQLTLNRDRGISAPFCAFFMPVPAIGDQGPQDTLPPNTVYIPWITNSSGHTRSFILPASLWQGSTGLLVLLGHIHDKRLLESLGAPLGIDKKPKPIAQLRAKAIWEMFQLSRDTLPDEGEFQRVLTDMLLKALASAQRTPPPNLVRSPDPQPFIPALPGAPPNWRPDPASRQLCFIAASCAYQGGFIDRALKSPSWAAGPADASMQRLIDWRNDISRPQPTLALLLGDQIYADATAGLFDPRSLDRRFEQPYLDAQQSRFLGTALSGIEIHTMLDDHEIDNNYSPIDHRDPDRFKENKERFDKGVRAYMTYQRFSVPGDPPHYNKALRQKEDLLDDYFFKHGFPFLIIDTRTHRAQRDALNVDRAPLIKDAQWTAIRSCIRSSRDDLPAFICTPSILLPRHLSTDENDPASALLSDAWDGYPADFLRLLIMLYREQAHNVVFLSGDEHLSCVARFTISCEEAPEGRLPVSSYSIHSSPLYAPYPFANGRRAELREYDDFTFEAPDAPNTRYRCVTETTFAPDGDGFAVLQVQTPGAGQNAAPQRGWSLDVFFSRADGVHTMQL